MIGPLVALMETPPNFQYYKGGVLDVQNGESDPLYNHAVLIVGYGTDNKGKDFWLLKNSAGTSWGDKIGRSKRNLFGIERYYVYYPFGVKVKNYTACDSPNNASSSFPNLVLFYLLFVSVSMWVKS